MRKTLFDQDFFIGKNKRLIKRIWKVEKSKEYPEGIEFAFQLLYYKEKWIQIVRIDNQLHEGKQGTHIHTPNRIVWSRINLDEIETTIIEIGERIIKWLELK